MKSLLEKSRVARKLGERLAAGDDTAMEDIRSVIVPIIRAGDEFEGGDVIMDIMLGMVSASMFESMYKRHLERLTDIARNPLLAMRDQTEAASIRKILAPTTNRNADAELEISTALVGNAVPTGKAKRPRRAV